MPTRLGGIDALKVLLRVPLILDVPAALSILFVCVSARRDNSVIATFISDGVTDHEVSKPMLSRRGSKLKAFVELAGGRLTMASPFVLYGLRLSASVVLALFVPHRLELDSGFWAGITAAVVCQPSLGSSLSKARVRAVGTIAILLLASAFPQNRIGLLVGLALWIGACGFFATILRHFASYGAALAGFTAAVIFADVIDAPGETFIIAATRMSEISIGIVSVAVVVMLTSVGDGRRRLAENLARVAQQTAAGLADNLAFGPDHRHGALSAQSLIRSVIALEALIEEAKAEEPQLRHRSEILRAGVEGLFSAFSAWRGLRTIFNKVWDDLGDARRRACVPWSWMRTASIGSTARNPCGRLAVQRPDGF